MDKKGVNVLYEFKSDWTELNYCNNVNDNQTISNLIEPIIQLNCIISRSVQWHIYSMCYMPYSIGIGFEKSSRKKWNLIWVFISVSIWSPYWFRSVFVMRVFLQNNRQGSTEKQIRITEREKESGATPISSVVLNNQPTWERSKKNSPINWKQSDFNTIPKYLSDAKHQQRHRVLRTRQTMRI